MLASLFYAETNMSLQRIKLILRKVKTETYYINHNVN